MHTVSTHKSTVTQQAAFATVILLKYTRPSGLGFICQGLGH